MNEKKWPLRASERVNPSIASLLKRVFIETTLSSISDITMK
jgi:hypothetical protein